jgi:regulator of RNase E activity RraA
MTTRDIQYISEPGDILVIDGGGGTDISNIGGQSCMVTKACGWLPVLYMVL